MFSAFKSRLLGEVILGESFYLNFVPSLTLESQGAAGIEELGTDYFSRVAKRWRDGGLGESGHASLQPILYQVKKKKKHLRW